MTNFLSFLVLCLIIVILSGYVRSFYLKQTPDQKRFLSGKVSESLPDGFYHGSAAGYSGSWQGKTFIKDKSLGINVFTKGEGSSEKYMFQTSVGKSVTDGINVIKIDYNIPENPFYVRLILDEIVEVGEGEYLGKLQIRLFGNNFITLAFFELKK